MGKPVTYAVERIKDNRLQGLLRELQEAIADTENPELLRKLGQSLKMLGDRARSKGYELQPAHKERFW